MYPVSDIVDNYRSTRSKAKYLPLTFSNGVGVSLSKLRLAVTVDGGALKYSKVIVVAHDLTLDGVACTLQNFSLKLPELLAVSLFLFPYLTKLTPSTFQPAPVDRSILPKHSNS